MTRDLEFQRSDGMMIRGRMYLPAEASPDAAEGKRFPLAVFAHGLGANYRELAHHGEGMAEDGICAFLFDFCGGGGESLSDGKTEDMTVPGECLDLETVLEGLWQLPYIDAAHTFLMGESLGGLVAALVGAKLKDKIAGLILWYPAFGMPEKVRRKFADLQVQAREEFGMTIGTAYYETAKEIDAYKEAAAYKGPVLMIHGDRDDIVPIRCSEDALEIYDEADLLIISGGGHGFDGEDSRNARESSVAFMKEHL